MKFLLSRREWNVISIIISLVLDEIFFKLHSVLRCPQKNALKSFVPLSYSLHAIWRFEFEEKFSKMFL